VRRARRVPADGWHAHDGLATVGYPKHHRVIQRGWGLVDRRRGHHIDGIESFWATAKTRLTRRRGIRVPYPAPSQRKHRITDANLSAG